ncbi:hypothetical protein V2S66_29290 [Streptomyces sp. V4-01]|uniref:Lipoprotein n=1 Tax=Actinacidiphila polyblastidii TaxID=3110430 RepID=A0ABU7PJN7_9ACTN|nr:hypothetical protein [Streptomyces sp. V4-01]
MSGREFRAAAVVCGTLALLAGCTLGAHGDPAPAEPALSGAAPPPIGSIEHPRPVDCVDGTAATTGRAGTPLADSPGSASLPPSPASSSPSARGSGSPPATAGSAAGTGLGADLGDVTVGPLTWRGLRGLATGDQQAHGVANSGGWHYRAGPAVTGDAVVTVTVGAEERARAGLEFGGGYGNTPAPAVTFHGCPASVTSFYGGFFVAGDGRACVPLDVRVGNGPTRRVVISFFNGPCPA